MSKFHEITLSPNQLQLVAASLDNSIDDSISEPLHTEITHLFDFIDELSENASERGETIDLDLTHRQVELIALALDDMSNSSKSPNKYNTLFEFFDNLAESEPVETKEVKLHLVYSRDSNIIPFPTKG